MPHIHLFNPGHETAILLGKSNYTPPANVRIMHYDLAGLPIWYGNADDYVYVPDASLLNAYQEELKGLPPTAEPIDRILLRKQASTLPSLSAAPWGVSLPALHQFKQLRKETQATIEIPAWKEEYVYLTGRRSAAESLDLLRTLLPGQQLPGSPLFCREIEEIEHYMQQKETPFVIKSPYSSSGRGVQWIHNHTLSDMEQKWITGALAKQGTISIEQGLCNQQDFAMEFYANGKGEVKYEGLSIFQTEKGSAYSGNRLQRQEKMEEFLTQWVSKEELQQVQRAVTAVLRKHYGSIYCGYLGVDMLIYQTAEQQYAIHPCIEINMRYTMGMVALQLYRHLLTEDAIGSYHMVYHKPQGEAYQQHLTMQKAYPLQTTVDGRITKGYLSLCPVTPTTHYRAYILIKGE